MSAFVPKGYVPIESKLKELGVNELHGQLAAGELSACWWDDLNGELRPIEARRWLLRNAESDLLFRGGWPVNQIVRASHVPARTTRNPRPPILIKVHDPRPVADIEAAGAETDNQKSSRFSRAQLETWYKQRVENWPAATPPPSREDDWTAAKREVSPGVPFKAVKQARRSFAPQTWTARGRRSARS